MALILNIDTALEKASVALADGEHIIGVLTNEKQMDHAAWIHGAISSLLDQSNSTISQLAAVAVSAGPGSYTGLRVGMATAKGICYSLKIPLITASTLKLVAMAATSGYTSPVVYCPMIDARRMEVFTVLYDETLNALTEAGPVVLSENWMSEYLESQQIVFCGNGSTKWQTICNNKNAIFDKSTYSIAGLVKLSLTKYAAGDFTDLAYSEPVYLKNIYMIAK